MHEAWSPFSENGRSYSTAEHVTLTPKMKLSGHSGETSSPMSNIGLSMTAAAKLWCRELQTAGRNN